MLDLLIEATDSHPKQTEEMLWDTKSRLFEEMDEGPIIEGQKEAVAFCGSATEMVPSLEVRGGWGLVLRRSEPRYIHAYHEAATVISLSDHISHFVLNDRLQGPPQGDASRLAKALVNLADDPAIREVALGSRLDSASLRDMIREVYSLLVTKGAPSDFLSAEKRSEETSQNASPHPLNEDDEAAQISAEADRLAVEFLSLPDTLEENPEILSAVEALVEWHAKRPPDDTEAWAEQLSEKLSRFTD